MTELASRVATIGAQCEGQTGRIHTLEGLVETLRADKDKDSTRIQALERAVVRLEDDFTMVTRIDRRRREYPGREMTFHQAGRINFPSDTLAGMYEQATAELSADGEIHALFEMNRVRVEFRLLLSQS